MTAPAITTFQSTEKDPERLLSAMVTGWALGFGTTVIPKRKVVPDIGELKNKRDRECGQG